MSKESMISLCIANLITLIALKTCNKKVTGKLLHIHMPCSACTSLKRAIHWLLRKAAVSSANLTPHSLLQMKNNSSNLNERSADRPIYLKELQVQGVQHPPTFQMQMNISLFEDRSKKAPSIHFKFSYCCLLALSLECDSLDFDLRSIETQIISILLCGILYTNHNH